MQSRKIRNQIFSGFVAMSMMFNFTGIMALADDSAVAEAPSTTSAADSGKTSPADRLEELANEAQAAAEKAKATKEAVEQSNEAATKGLSDVENANTEAEEALQTAQAADKNAAETTEESKSVVEEAQKAIEEAKTVKEQQEAIDKAVAEVEKVIEKANTAVEKAEKVVDEAVKIKAEAEQAAEQANEAISQAQTALEKAEEAEKIYHDLLQEAVTGDLQVYRALAIAENTMNQAWNEYSAQQEKATELKVAAQDKAIEATENAEIAVEAVTEAYEAANVAQQEADRLYSVWQEAERAMQTALDNTNDAELKALEASRAKARDAAIMAQDSAMEARQKAVDTYVIAKEAIDIANEAVDKVNNADWSVDQIVDDLEKLAEESKLVDERDWKDIKKKKEVDKSIAGFSKTSYYVKNFGSFSPGSLNNNSKEPDMDKRISGYLPVDHDGKIETKAHAFLRLFNGDNHKDAGYSINMPKNSDLDYVLIKTNDGKWFTWSNTKKTNIKNFEGLALTDKTKQNAYTEETYAPERDITGLGIENGVTITTPRQLGPSWNPLMGEMRTTYWVEKTEFGYEIHMLNHMVQMSNSKAGQPGIQYDCVVGEDQLLNLAVIYGELTSGLAKGENGIIGGATGTDSPGMELSQLGGYGTRTNIEIPEVPTTPGGETPNGGNTDGGTTGGGTTTPSTDDSDEDESITEYFVPLSSGDNSEVVILDTEIPLTDAEIVEIEEEAVPLATLASDIPQTSDNTQMTMFILLAMLSMGGLGILLVAPRKRESN